MQTWRARVREVVDGGRRLCRAQAGALLGEMLAPASAATDIEIAALLTALAVRGETAEELAGFADTLRSLATPLPLTDAERARLVDTCGTGGDGSGTFTISTGAALVAAAAGALVAKHGNRAVTSKCGSADVLEALGVPVALSPQWAVACLRATGFMFLYAPALQPAMARAAPVRRALGFRTIFNLAGPLTNPAGAPAQLMGVWAESKLAVVAEAMAMLGVRHAYVVHGGDIDELTTTGPSLLVEVRAGTAGTAGAPRTVFPDQLGLARATAPELAGGETAAENAAMLERVLTGEAGPRRDIVLLNAAAALVLAGLAEDLRAGLACAASAIDSGAASATVAQLRAFGSKFG
jgi:anthranilate phosphoribosyltransferase